MNTDSGASFDMAQAYTPAIDRRGFSQPSRIPKAAWRVIPQIDKDPRFIAYAQRLPGRVALFGAVTALAALLNLRRRGSVRGAARHGSCVCAKPSPLCDTAGDAAAALRKRLLGRCRPFTARGRARRARQSDQPTPAVLRNAGAGCGPVFLLVDLLAANCCDPVVSPFHALPDLRASLPWLSLRSRRSLRACPVFFSGRSW